MRIEIVQIVVVTALRSQKRMACEWKTIFPLIFTYSL